MKTIYLFGSPYTVSDWWYGWVTHMANVSPGQVAADYLKEKLGTPQEDLPAFSAYWRKRYPETEQGL